MEVEVVVEVVVEVMEVVEVMVVEMVMVEVVEEVMVTVEVMVVVVVEVMVVMEVVTAVIMVAVMAEEVALPPCHRGEPGACPFSSGASVLVGLGRQPCPPLFKAETHEGQADGS